MNKINILMCGFVSNYGGIEAFTLNYSKFINKNKINLIHINICDDAKDKAFYKELSSINTIYTLPNYKKHPIQFLKKLKKIVIHHNIDIFHYNMNSAVFLTPLICAKICGIKTIISHAHNASSDKGILKSFLHHINKKILLLFANTFFSCSTEAGSWFFSKKIMKSDNYFIINNAIDVSKYSYNFEIREQFRSDLHLPKDAFVLGNIARFNKQKNHLFLIDIFNNYLKYNQNSYLILLGSGPLLNTIQEKVQKLGITKNVLFLGQKNNIHEYLNVMDLFILPSLYEGLPMVGVEAQANGLRCYFSDCITREVDISKQNKYISLTKTADDWANEIYLFDKNYNIRKQISNIVYHSEFNIKQSSLILENIYRKLYLKHR